MRICLMGFGAVGQGVAEVIARKNDYLKETLNMELKLVAVTDSSGAAISPNGLDPELLLKTKRETGKVINYSEDTIEGIDSIDVLDNVEYDVLVEVIPTNIEDGEPAKSLTLKALNDKKDVVTSNKGHLALFYKELINTAKENGVEFKYEASVGGAMPILNFAEETLSGNEIKSIKGILNGTTNFILSRMTTEGSSYEGTLHEAQQLGFAETNPYQDVEGIDAACKTVILANDVLNIDCTLKDVEITGITDITSAAIDLAKKEGYFIKLISEISPEKLEVAPRLVKMDSPYAVEGSLNMATLKTDLADEVSVVGLGAGSVETASAILSDLVSIHKLRQTN